MYWVGKRGEDGKGRREGRGKRRGERGGRGVRGKRGGSRRGRGVERGRGEGEGRGERERDMHLMQLPVLYILQMSDGRRRDSNGTTENGNCECLVDCYYSRHP